MLEREAIIVELWRRLSSVSGVSYTARNPKAPPSTSDFPAIQFFEMRDAVTDATDRGGYPVYKRRLTVAIESFIKATSEPAATKELGAFIQEMKKKVYDGGHSLGRKCSILETEASRVLRPPAGENSIGLGIVFEITYIEDTSLLFA